MTSSTGAPLVDAFDVNDTPNYRPETPDLGEVMLEAMRLHTLGLRVCLPAYVLAVNGNQCVDVQPSLQMRYGNSATAQDMPSVKNVPVAVWQGAQYSIKLPIAEGDTGALLFADRSLDAWLHAPSGIGTIDPADTRQHALTDAIFFPGLVPFAEQTQDTTGDMVLRAGNMQMRFLQSGKAVIGSTAEGGQELLDLVDQMMALVSSLIDTLANKTMTLTLIGPQPFLASSVALLTALKSQCDGIRHNLDTLKS